MPWEVASESVHGDRLTFEIRWEAFARRHALPFDEVDLEGMLAAHAAAE